MSEIIGPEVLALLIPIVAIVGAFAVAIVGIVVGGKKKEHEHKERMLALEKGLPLPEPPEETGLPYTGRRAAGFVFLGLGIALVVALWVVAGAVGGVWGLVPALIGIALLVAASVDKRDYERRMGQEAAQEQI